MLKKNDTGKPPTAEGWGKVVLTGEGTTATAVLPASVIEAVLPFGRRATYRAKSMIVRAGETPNAIYFILKGSVSVLMEDEDGHELILAYLGPGEFFGELGLFEGDAKRSAMVRTRIECEVVTVAYDKFRALCRENVDLLLCLTGQIASRLRTTSRRMGHLAFLDVTGRIARTLLDLARDSEAITHPDGMLIRITREELSRIVNCSREMAGRVLHDLEQQGLIQVEGKSVVVHGTR
jgi:CRP/FNR family cyclic AMP-dependent transcriptional regulator